MSDRTHRAPGSLSRRLLKPLAATPGRHGGAPASTLAR